MNYILNGKKTAAEPNLIKWAQWFENANRIVAKTITGGIKISTVFLGIDHSYDDKEPILFETMVFGGPMDEEMLRYSTWEDALYGHQQMVESVKEKLSKPKPKEFK